MKTPRILPRPDCPAAAGFETYLCTDPLCGLHVVALDAEGKPICELVLSRPAILRFLDVVHELGFDVPLKDPVNGQFQ